MDFLSGLNAARILVVERDPDLMDEITSVLEEAGYAVHKAYYVGDAFYAMKNREFDLALIDAQMSDRNGRMLVHQMSHFDWIPWVALVDDSHAAPHTLLEQGASAFVQIPCSAGVLLRHVENVLNGQPMALGGELPLPEKPVQSRDDELSRLLAQRLNEQQTISRLARSLSAVLDLDVLLTQVVDAAVSLSHAEEGLLLLPDEGGEALLIRAAKGLDSKAASNFRVKTQDTLAGQVFRTGQPVLVGDQGPQKIKTEYLVKSLLYVPLSIKGEIIGVLGVNNKHSDRTFTQHDQELLQDLAAHAAVAIENARLYEESVLRTRELTTLVEASQAANSTLAIDQVLSVIARQLIGALEVGQCLVAEWTPGDPLVRMLAVCYQALWRPTAGPVLDPARDPVLEQAFATKRAVQFTPDREYGDSDALDDALVPHRCQAQGVIYLPLLAHDQPLGVIALYRLRDPFDDPDFQAAQYEVRQVAVDILGALAGSDMHHHQDRLFALAERLTAVAGADWLEIALWHTARRRLNVTLSYGEAIWRDEPKPRLALDRFSSLQEILNGQRTVSQTSGDGLAPLMKTSGGQSVLGLPLIIKGKTAGLVLLIDTMQARTFTRREIELARTLVLQAANALDNARLYRDLELSLQELHQTQSRLVQTARLSAMGELAAAVAHQINNPLTTILGDAELMLRDLSPEDPNVESLEAIFRAGKRAHEVVRRLLTMARQQSPDETPVALHVNDTIRNTLTLVETHIRHARIRLHVNLADDLPPVAGVQGQLEDVWLNLLLNARDAVAGQEDAQIGIGSRFDSSLPGVEVIVWDNGAGIPEEVLDHIFEPFFTTKPPGEGTGLGLHICQQIVKKCGGSITVKSAYNEGTRFFVVLPTYEDGVRYE